MKFINYMWVGVIELVAVVVLLVLKVGVSALAGVAVLLFIMFLQAEVGKLFLKFR